MALDALKVAVVTLYKKGETYSNICRALGQKVPKSTFSYWCHDIQLTTKAAAKRHLNALKLLKKARKKAVASKQLAQERTRQHIRLINAHLLTSLKKPDVAKIALIALYACEGMKKPNRASVTFGNSSPSMIQFFLRLLRKCYPIDETKFRCTLQCRADQNTNKLEEFWSATTGIPKSQFYTARIDERTRGFQSKNMEYKGVCRIDYFSAAIFKELLETGRLLTEGL